MIKVICAIGLAIFIITFLIVLHSQIKAIEKVCEAFEEIFEAYTEQYNDFIDEQEKLCDLLQQYHELLDGYQIPLIQIPDSMKPKPMDDW